MRCSQFTVTCVEKVFPHLVWTCFLKFHLMASSFVTARRYEIIYLSLACVVLQISILSLLSVEGNSTPGKGFLVYFLCLRMWSLGKDGDQAVEWYWCLFSNWEADESRNFQVSILAQLYIFSETWQKLLQLFPSPWVFPLSHWESSLLLIKSVISEASLNPMCQFHSSGHTVLHHTDFSVKNNNNNKKFIIK